MSVPRLRAPKEHGQILAMPPLAEAGRLLAANHVLVNAARLSPAGPPLSELRLLARAEITARSTQYHLDAGQPIADQASDLWLVAGHQPELFHPGVWFKHFALQQLARKHGAMALNLIVDTDTAKPALLHAPSEGRLARIAFDHSVGELPYEERAVEEEAMFADLPERMKPIVARWNFEPMLDTYWREVMVQAERTPLLGERLAAARRAVERRWGCVQREVPMSQVCQTEAFAHFAWAILARLPEFHAIHNQTAQEYRRVHGIRSRSHPVPDLATDGDWLETPFWAWRRGQTRRGKLFARRASSALELRAGDQAPSTVRLGAPADWRALETQGVKIRSRALTTTMFARLFVADVFIHGIGGGIYDELTDRIIERFFAMPAPAFLTVSATLLLPLPRFPDAAAQVRDLARQWRDLVYKPERFVKRRFVKEWPVIESLMSAKQKWVARPGATHAERAERFTRIREINARLLPYVLPLTQQVQVDHLEQLRHAEWDAVASRRDYAFCLYPEEMLRTFFQAGIA